MVATSIRCRLTGRPGPGGSDCGTGAGETARTNFVIVDGRILEWIRAPDDPGDNHTPTTPSPVPGAAKPEPDGAAGARLKRDLSGLFRKYGECRRICESDH